MANSSTPKGDRGPGNDFNAYLAWLVALLGMSGVALWFRKSVDLLSGTLETIQPSLTASQLVAVAGLQALVQRTHMAFLIGAVITLAGGAVATSSRRRHQAHMGIALAAIGCVVLVVSVLSEHSLEWSGDSPPAGVNVATPADAPLDDAVAVGTPGTNRVKMGLAGGGTDESKQQAQMLITAHTLLNRSRDTLIAEQIPAHVLDHTLDALLQFQTGFAQHHLGPESLTEYFTLRRAKDRSADQEQRFQVLKAWYDPELDK